MSTLSSQEFRKNLENLSTKGNRLEHAMDLYFKDEDGRPNFGEDFVIKEARKGMEEADAEWNRRQGDKQPGVFEAGMFSSLFAVMLLQGEALSYIQMQNQSMGVKVEELQEEVEALKSLLEEYGAESS